MNQKINATILLFWLWFRFAYFYSWTFNILFSGDNYSNIVQILSQISQNSFTRDCLSQFYLCQSSICRQFFSHDPNICLINQESSPHGKCPTCYAQVTKHMAGFPFVDRLYLLFGTEVSDTMAVHIKRSAECAKAYDSTSLVTSLKHRPFIASSGPSTSHFY